MASPLLLERLQAVCHLSPLQTHLGVGVWLVLGGGDNAAAVEVLVDCSCGGVGVECLEGGSVYGRGVSRTQP